MNKFIILSCIKVKEEDYAGRCVILGCINDPTFMLFFPVSEENAQTIKYVLDGNDDYDVNTNILGIYKTMVSSWISSDRYLSGVIMDTVYDKDMEEEVLTIRLALSTQSGGELDSLVPVNFLHAVLLAAMENVEIIVSEKLLEQMVPSFSPEEPKEGPKNKGRKPSKKKKKKTAPHFPEDKQIIDIAKKIMSSNIKDGDSESKSEPK